MSRRDLRARQPPLPDPRPGRASHRGGRGSMRSRRPAYGGTPDTARRPGRSAAERGRRPARGRSGRSPRPRAGPSPAGRSSRRPRRLSARCPGRALAVPGRGRRRLPGRPAGPCRPGPRRWSSPRAPQGVRPCSPAVEVPADGAEEIADEGVHLRVVGTGADAALRRLRVAVERGGRGVDELGPGVSFGQGRVSAARAPTSAVAGSVCPSRSGVRCVLPVCRPEALVPDVLRVSAGAA